MTDVHVYVRDIRELAKVPENGILSQTLQNDDRTKVILFGFAAGQELSAHTAPFPATLIFLKGEAHLRLGGEEQLATEGTFVYMPPNLEHGIKAQSEVVMLLTMIKNPPASHG
ncbi:MAG TPA: cupin domain-containing protein [Verrucomicrobiae bacterium]|jgi:quercetin dioxygenase-like cupin family protein